MKSSGPALEREASLSPLRSPVKEKLPLAVQIVALQPSLRRKLGGRGLAKALDLHCSHRRCRKAVANAATPARSALGLLAALPDQQACLGQSLLVLRLLARHSIPSLFVPSPDFPTHSWVEHEDVPVLPPGTGRYWPLWQQEQTVPRSRARGCLATPWPAGRPVGLAETIAVGGLCGRSIEKSWRRTWGTVRNNRCRLRFRSSSIVRRTSPSWTGDRAPERQSACCAGTSSSPSTCRPQVLDPKAHPPAAVRVPRVVPAVWRVRSQRTRPQVTNPHRQAVHA